MRCAFDVGASWSVSRLQNLNQIGSLGGKLQRDKDLLSFRETKTYSVCLFTLLFFLHAFVRSSRPEVLCKKGVLRNFGKFIEKHMCQKLFFNKKESLSQVFFCEFCEIFTEHLWWLLLFS